MRIVLAVLAGFIAVAIVALGGDKLVSLAVSPAEMQTSRTLTPVLIYSLVACAVGGYVAALIGAFRAGLILAGLVVVFTIFNLVSMPTPAPLWWKIADAVLCGPLTVAGARLVKMRA